MKDKYPEGYLVEVTMTVRVPIPATPEHIEEWLAFAFGSTGTCKGDNPLIDHDHEIFGVHGFDIKFTNEIGTCVDYDHKDVPGEGKTFKRRYDKKYIFDTGDV